MPSSRDVLHARAPTVRAMLVHWPAPTALAATAAGLALVVGGIVALLGFGAPLALVALGAYALLAAAVLVAFEAAAPAERFGPANTITLVRGALNALLLGLLAEPATLSATWGEGAGWLFLAVALVSLALDGVDGRVARRWRLTSAFGARFDVEIDALLLTVLALAAVVLGKVGLWVLAIPLGYYAFLAARAVWPWLAQPLPPSRRRKAVFVAQAASLGAVVAPPVVPPLAAGLAALTLAAMVASFARDLRWLWVASARRERNRAI